MRIFHLHTTPDGGSAIVMRKIPMADGQRPLSETFRCKSVFFRDTPQGNVENYHNAPRRQLIAVTSGILEIETSDGKRHTLQPGDLVFAEDFTGKGHITRSLRGVRGFMHLVMPADFEVSAWPIVTDG